MATARPRTAGIGAARRQSIRVYNEPFTPSVEEIDENEAHILRLQLPDFNKQRVNVKVEQEARTVTVTGDRLVTNTRLLILDKTYPIPENCVIDKIHHKLEAGFLTITMPKQTTAPVTAPAAAETVATPPKAEQTTPEKVNEEISPEKATPPPKEPEQTTPEKVNEEISPEKATPPPKEPEQTALEKGSEEISPENATQPPKEPEQTTPEKGSEEISPENAAPPETKAEIKESEEEDKGKSAELQKKAPLATPRRLRAVLQSAVADKWPVQGESSKAKTTPYKKISSPDQKQTVKKKIENQSPEKGKESKTEEVGKNEETDKIGTGTPPPRATEVGKLDGGFKVRRMSLPVKASLAAAVVTAVAAYFAFAYYGLLFARE